MDTEKIAAYRPITIPPESYKLRDAVVASLTEAGPDEFTIGITPGGEVLVWLDNWLFRAHDTPGGVMLCPETQRPEEPHKTTRAHCSNGHPITPANTYTWRGQNRCLVCKLNRSARARVRRRPR